MSQNLSKLANPLRVVYFDQHYLNPLAMECSAYPFLFDRAGETFKEILIKAKAQRCAKLVKAAFTYV